MRRTSAESNAVTNFVVKYHRDKSHGDCSGGHSDARPNAGALLTCAPKEKQH